MTSFGWILPIVPPSGALVPVRSDGPSFNRRKGAFSFLEPTGSPARSCTGPPTEPASGPRRPVDLRLVPRPGPVGAPSRSVAGTLESREDRRSVRSAELRLILGRLDDEPRMEGSAILPARGRQPGELPEIPDHVRLIEVAALDGVLGPVGMRALVGETQGVLEADQSKIALRRDTEQRAEGPSEMPLGEAELARQVGDPGRDVASVQARPGDRHARRAGRAVVQAVEGAADEAAGRARVEAEPHRTLAGADRPALGPTSEIPDDDPWRRGGDDEEGTSPSARDEVDDLGRAPPPGGPPRKRGSRRGQRTGQNLHPEVYSQPAAVAPSFRNTLEIASR